MPLRTAVVPTVIAAVDAEIVQEPPRVQLVEFIEIVGLTKSAFVTSPVAVNEPVTMGAGIVSALGSVVEMLGAPAPEVTRTPLLPAFVLPSTPALS